MSKFLFVLAAVLIAPSSLSASVIPDPPEEVLVRPVAEPDPTPAFAPGFHYTRGPELPYPDAPYQEETYAGAMPFTAACLILSGGILLMIPRLQLILLRLRLLN